MLPIDLQNRLTFDELIKCCGSQKWAKELLLLKPFSSLEDLLNKSDLVWAKCTKVDALEAFSHHPKIGDLKNLEKKFATTKEWAGNEQAGVNSANTETLVALAKGNELYEKNFGYIFIVCATGKTAQEMLDFLNARINNAPEKELLIAMEEQNKITKIRLQKLLS